MGRSLTNLLPRGLCAGDLAEEGLQGRVFGSQQHVRYVNSLPADAMAHCIDLGEWRSKVVRIQFYAFEISRNRLGLNDILYEKVRGGSSPLCFTLLMPLLMVPPL
jgi:hypothetical protein